MEISYESVVVFLYTNEDAFLFQLRDQNTEIYPMSWGLFGGSLDGGETIIDAAKRELMEEINHCPDIVEKVSDFYIEKAKNLVHVCHGCLDVDISMLELKEGADIGLFNDEEVLSGRLFSSRYQQHYPIIPKISEVYLNFSNYKRREIDSSPNSNI